MEKISKNWTEIKNLHNTCGFPFRYDEQDTIFYVSVIDIITQKEYTISIPKQVGNIEYDEWIATYKPKADIPVKPLSEDGKEIVISTSRPVGTHTVFTDRGDSATDIGDGKKIAWDFANDNDEVNQSSGLSIKQKKLEFSFLDSVWVKDGTIYYFNVLKGSYLDFYVVCPTGSYYLDNAGNVQLATEDTPIIHYGIHNHMQDSVPMGDELNTETRSEEIKPPYKFWVYITVPITDVQSNGYIRLELYRKRSVIL